MPGTPNLFSVIVAVLAAIVGVVSLTAHSRGRGCAARAAADLARPGV